MSIVGIITAVGAVATTVGIGASMYGKYKEGSTLEDTDWGGMMADTTQLFEDNITNMRDKASNAFKEVQHGWRQGVKSLADKGTDLWTQAGGGDEGGGGFAKSGETTYAMGQALEDINRDADTLSKGKKIAEEGLQLDFEGLELALGEEYEEDMADLGGAEEASEDWYPGKYVGKVVSDARLKENISLVGKSPSWINIYEVNYIGNPIRYRGVMADEVGYASSTNKDGYYMVDYSKVDVEFKKV